jgi:cytochrome P450
MLTRRLDRARAAELLVGLRGDEGIRDPYPIYAQLRELAPAIRVGRTDIVVTHYRECAAVLRDGSYGACGAAWRDQQVQHVPDGRPWRDSPALVDLSKFMLACDPPEHTRLRDAFAAFFSPGRVRSLRPAVEQVAADVVAEFVAVLEACGTADFVELVAMPLPMRVAGWLLGIPAPDCMALAPLLDEMTLTLGPSPAAGELERADQAALAVRDYMTGLLAGGRRGEEGSALAAWTAAAGRDGALTPAEMANAVPILLQAGSGPARLMLGNLMNILTRSPELAAQLREFPALAPAAADESARLDAPIQMVSRLALRDSEVGAVQVHPGDSVHVMIGSANRDPRYFEHPDEADLRRSGPRLLSYSQGVHRCLGAALGATEIAALLPALLGALGTWSFAGPPARFPSTSFRGFVTMPVTLQVPRRAGRAREPGKTPAPVSPGAGARAAGHAVPGSFAGINRERGPAPFGGQAN